MTNLSVQPEKINYHRIKPVREFALDKTMYSNVIELNKENLSQDAIRFFTSRFSYANLFDRSDRLASAYYQVGATVGKTVAIATILTPVVQENMLALSKVGATQKWIDLRIKERDLINNLNESDVRTVVAFDEVVGPLLEKIIDETNVERVILSNPKDYLNPIIRKLATFKERYKEGKVPFVTEDKRFIRLEDFIKTGKNKDIVTPAPFDKDRPSIIVQSSGSTGKAKSIVHTEYNFNSEMQKEAYTDLPFKKGKTIFCSIPPFIIYSLVNSVYASMMFSLTALMTPFLEDTTILDALGQFDYACGVPLQYRAIYDYIMKLHEEIEELEQNPTSKNKMRLKKLYRQLEAILKKLERTEVFISGGDSIGAQEILDMEHEFSTPIVNGYGNNENTGAAIISPLYGNKPASVGVPLKGVTVKAFDLVTDEELGPNQIGKLKTTSDSLFVEYLNNPEETKRIKQVDPKTGTAWVYTGDVGYVDEDNFVYLVDRADRLIKRKSFKISPTTIEDLITTVPGVKDCVVVGVSDEEDFEVPMAFIEQSEDVEIETKDLIARVQQKCEEILPDYEIPKYYEMIEAIPYHNGKKGFKQLGEIGEQKVQEIKKLKK
jgi:acyl-coenzyme A synthetase/AMP-(fatty) acid ligase